MTFKEGDIVRATSSSYGARGHTPAFLAGETYVVAQDHDGGGGSVMITRDSNGSTSNGWGAQFFKLAYPPFELAYPPSKKTAALQTQVGGTHYSDMAIQPAAFNLANNMGWAEGDAISYISRWRKKGGLQDLRKARQTLLLLIEHEEALGTE